MNFFRWMSEQPDAARALRNYHALAAGYDDSSRRSVDIRAAAIEALTPAPGEVVLDIACGTGMTLIELARHVGPTGRAIGVELSPDMARIASRKIDRLGLRAELVVGRAEEIELNVRADAMLFCYTHDVLRSDAAIANLMRFAKPGCRIVVAGMQFQPWLIGWPLNLFTAIRARHYVTTFRGLRDPCAKLRAAGVTMRHLRYFHCATSHLAGGRFKAGSIATAPDTRLTEQEQPVLRRA